MTNESTSIRRVARGISLVRLKKLEEAESGRPQALRELLQSVAAFLYNKREIESSSLYFVADALKNLTADAALWSEAEAEFQQLHRSNDSIEERLSGLGSRISEATQGRIGRAFCRAFHLARPQGKLKKRELPKKSFIFPPEVEKLEKLRFHGLSRRDAINIVHQAYPELSARKLDEWVRATNVTAAESETLGGGLLIENQCRMAADVLREHVRGKTLDEACKIAAHRLACRFFPDLTDRLASWSARTLHEAEDGRQRSREHLDLARRIESAAVLGKRLPKISREIHSQIEQELAELELSTSLPDESLSPIAKAARKAYDTAQWLRSVDPRWARIWSYLERRYSRSA